MSNGYATGGTVPTNLVFNGVTVGSGTYSNPYTHSNNTVFYGTVHEYDHPIKECERDCMKIMQYELIGLNKSHITEKVEFVNKTKETYLTLKGTYKDEYTDFENEINIRLKVDTEIYNSYVWWVKDGILTLILFEIKNEQPRFTNSYTDANVLEQARGIWKDRDKE